MKPESVKYLLDCFIEEKRASDECGDVVDGIHNKLDSNFPVAHSRKAEMSVHEDFISDYSSFTPAVSYGSPEPQHYEPLNPEQEALARNIARQLSELSDDFEMERSMGNAEIKKSENCSIQFKQHCMFFASSSDTLIEVPLMRSGNTESECRISYRTRDRTAIGGTHYASARGSLHFAKDEKFKTIELKLLDVEGKEDLCLEMELCDPEHADVGSNDVITLFITDHDNLPAEEIKALENIFNSGCSTVSCVASCLSKNVTSSTFKAALHYVCSSANSVPQELAFGLELLRLTLPKVRGGRRSSLSNVVCNFFTNIPELEDIGQYFGEA